MYTIKLSLNICGIIKRKKGSYNNDKDEITPCFFLNVAK